jgi:arabinofuranosyltransferase
LAVSAPTRRRWLGLSMGLIVVVLSRPEGMLVAPVLLFVGFVSSALWAAPSVRRAALSALPVGLVVLATIVGLVVFRLRYFGYPVPNTYYVKVGNDPFFTAFRGLGYTAQFLLGNPAYLLTGFAALQVYRSDLPLALRALRRGSSGEPPIAPEAIARLGLSVISLMGVALPLLEGRDHFVAGRMLQPFVPLFCALMGFQVAELLRDAQGYAVRRNVLVGLAAAVLFGWTRFMVSDAFGFKRELELASHGRIIGQQLLEHLDARTQLPTLGVVTAGGMAFTYPGRTLDLIGLNWLRMAHASRQRYGAPGHASFSAKVFWSEPASIMVPKLRARLPHDASEACTRFENRVLDGLFLSPRFRAAYQAFGFAIPEGQIVAYARRDWLQTHRVRDARRLDWPTDPAELAHSCSGR